ncbi:MAG: glycosyltransferase family 2 protein [Chitinophagales bacterium]|nr:glycosyltransferase family 2 protein [Chitinophagales bacterium]
MFSIIIPTWNNFSFLRLCVQSIQQNSAFAHQIILHINNGSDGTLQWAQNNGIAYTHSAENIGICKAVNMASQKITEQYVVFMNDDMYCLPGWDNVLADEIAKLNADCFMLSATMIEPYNTRNKCVVVADYGKGVEDFREQNLLSEYKNLVRSDWSGSTWPPSVVHKKWWDAVGGYSEEFSPGMSSDDDFAMKMWQAGCRIYKGVGNSLVYHFISKSTGRIARNDGRKQFMQKWGIKQSAFHKYYTRRGEDYQGKLQEPGRSIGLLWERFLAKFVGK